MMTITSDSNTRVILDVQISWGQPRTRSVAPQKRDYFPLNTEHDQNSTETLWVRNFAAEAEQPPQVTKNQFVSADLE